MNITFLIGNGFDIGLGLKTRYEDFYEIYCQNIQGDNDNIIQFKKMLSNRNLLEDDRIIDWSDFEIAFGQHSNNFSLGEKQDYLDQFEDFILKFNAYLAKEENAVDYSNAEKIATTMKNAVAKYIDIRTGDKEEIQKIYNALGGSRIYKFISFNYTKTVDICAEILKKTLKSDNSRDVGKVVHIHGYIDENMIMGVNDRSQISNFIFQNEADVISEIVKPQQNADIRSNYEREMIKLISSSDIICIYGMSIGETDKKWWNYIAEWLSKGEKRALVILKYDKKYDKRFPFNQTKFVNTVVENFLSLSEQPSELIKKIRSRIYVGMNHNIFEMNLRKERDALTQLSEEYAAYLNSEEYKEQLEQRAIREEVLKKYKGAI